MPVQSDATSVTIVHPQNPRTFVKILNFGATAVSWQVDGSEKLWLSESAKLDGTKAIRGGIPIVFPRFGPPTGTHPPTDELPQHGFARNSVWEFLGQIDDQTVQFGLGPEHLSPESREQWNYDFTLLLTFALVSADQLELRLSIENPGTEKFDFTTLLHTYYRVPEITKTTVSGFNGLSFYNKVADTNSESTTNVLDFTEAFDRVYHHTPPQHVISCDGQPLYTIDASPEFEDTVVWNPWSEGAESMSDFAPKTGFHQMLCVENGSVHTFKQLAPSEKYTASIKIRAH